MNSQRKRIAVLCTVLIAGGGWIGLASRTATGQAESAAWTTDADRPFLSDPNHSAPGSLNLGSSELFLRMMLSIGLVIVLGGGAWYVSRKVLPRVAGASGKEIRVRETTHLGPHKALHLVEVGGRRFLIGSTGEHIATLAHLTDEGPDAPRNGMDGTVNT